jgi:hypothetical protein
LKPFLLNVLVNTLRKCRLCLNRSKSVVCQNQLRPAVSETWAKRHRYWLNFGHVSLSAKLWLRRGCNTHPHPHTHTHTHGRAHAHTHTCTHTRIHTHAHTHTHTYTHIHTHTHTMHI